MCPDPKPAGKAYQSADGGGLFVEVMPGGAKVWRFRYRLGGRGSKQEKVTLGNYPTDLAPVYVLNQAGHEVHARTTRPG
ncbi:Arm DNA-binding domain-containing protein [Methylococcus geothermalis]|uniref:Arm DNA-binding domain-containing protein n=1 Tax=Methylococcus geothermalis TaxID=2681310 RepID=UPI001CB75722|nr:Arm DNA-binding domain-containing protein [Methylococcus geothermalis]